MTGDSMAGDTEIKRAIDATGNYFSEMSRTHNTQGGTKEESHYPALTALLNAIGEDLSVVCVSQLKDQGADHPDFGLYAAEQADRPPPVMGQAEPPKHGVIEAKGVEANLVGLDKSDQVKKYLRGYELVITTNYREFCLFRKVGGGAELLETLTIADSAIDYWEMIATAKSRQTAARQHGPRLWEFLKRSMNYASSISEPKHVAAFLASYAREALAKVEAANQSDKNTDLQILKDELEAGLGKAFEGKTKSQGDHLFCSMLVQTLFYGMFSAWAAHVRKGSDDSFNWKLAGWAITIPVIKNIFERLAGPSQASELDLEDVLERTAGMLGRVEIDTFFRNFTSGEAIQHFYQPFLKAFDPDSQVTMGVWYTPPEIVEYMVERVDRVLRDELKITDGLANENVIVLDPCCGTGAYIIEVLRRIKKTLCKESKDDSVGDAVKKAALTRVKGFEVMPAPFVIAHWRVNEFLSSIEAPMDEGSRAKIILTNSLTGWDKKDDQKNLTLGLKDEHDLASDVKLNDRILVVISNPPYYGHAKVMPGEEARLVKRYKDKLKASGAAKKSQLDDPYVKFFSVAEERVLKESRGIVSYITNASYLIGRSFTGVRQSFLESFDKMWIDETSGDIFKIGDFQDGIERRVATNLLLKASDQNGDCTVLYRNLDGQSPRLRREELLKDVADEEKEFESRYDTAKPRRGNNWSLSLVETASSDYDDWPSVTEICKIRETDQEMTMRKKRETNAKMTPRERQGHESGMHENRDWALIDSCRSALECRMKEYYCPSLSWQDLCERGHKMNCPKTGYEDPEEVWKKTREAKEVYDDDNIISWAAFPLDTRYAYVSRIQSVWNRCRPVLLDQRLGNDRFLAIPASMSGNHVGFPAAFSSVIGNYHHMSSQTSFFPFIDYVPSSPSMSEKRTANLSKKARYWMANLGFSDIDSNDDSASLPWFHVLSICYSRAYVSDNAKMLKVDYPNIPIPDNRDKLIRSAELGKDVATLLDVSNVNMKNAARKLIPHGIKILGRVCGNDYLLDGKWTHVSDRGISPGRGIVGPLREWDNEERTALLEAFSSMEVDERRGFELLGKAREIHLNANCHWKSVPDVVWNFRIGNRQVIRKWLSYRSETVIGRKIDVDTEVKYVKGMIWRLATLILMTDQLDANYEACRDNAYQWCADGS